MSKLVKTTSALALALSASAAWGQTPAPTQCTNVVGSTAANDAPPTISVAVASNFDKPGQAIAADFLAEAGNMDKVIRICHNSTGNLADEINTGTSGYDLLLAADNTSIDEKVDDEWKVDGSEFLYTEGIPILWTNTTGVSISGGDVTNASVVSLAVADPSKAPYGVAGLQILNKTEQMEAAEPKIGPYFDNIALTQAAIADGSKSAGFIAKSQVCLNGTVSGVAYYEDWPAGSYTPVKQQGVILKPNVNSTLTGDFVTYLLGTEAQNTLVNQYCYRVRPAS